MRQSLMPEPYEGNTAQYNFEASSVCQCVAQLTELPPRERTRIRRVWSTMVARCSNPTNTSFRHYGARGVQVCERWRNSVDAFVRDMGIAPIGFSIERINNDGHYEPSNCRWATVREQAQNKRRTRRLRFRGVTLSISDMARRYGLTEMVVRTRLDRQGWTIEEALLTPLIPRGKRGQAAKEIRRGARQQLLAITERKS